MFSSLSTPPTHSLGSPIRSLRHARSQRLVPRGSRVAVLLVMMVIASTLSFGATPAGADVAGGVPATTAAAPGLPAMPALPALPDFSSTFATAGPATPGSPNLTGMAATVDSGLSSETSTTSTTMPGSVPLASTTTTTLPDWFATSTGSQVTEAGQMAMKSLAQRYGSFGGAMLGLYAQQTGQPLGQFAEANAGIVQSLTGSTIGDELTAALAGSGNLEQLQSTLAQSGLSGSTTATGSPSFDATLSTISERPNSLDSQVVVAAADWTAGFANLRMPTVDTASLGSVAPTGAGLSVGSYVNTTLAAMAADYPNLLGQVTASGRFSPQSQAAWQASMLKAFAATSKSNASSLPAPCNAALLAGMASGSANAAAAAGGAGCGSCATAGLYMNSQMSRLTDPKATTAISNPTDGFIPPTEWGNLQSWQRNALVSQNPQLAKTLTASAATPTSCSGNTSGAVGVSLSGVFSNLNRR